MNLKTLGLIALLFLTIGCFDERKSEKREIVEVKEQTPEVLEDGIYTQSKYSTRGNRDIVFNLYKEALDNNSRLKDLNADIQALPKKRKDSLESYRRYIKTHDQYWQSAKLNIRGIKDSVLRASAKEMFATLESKFEARLSDHESISKSIDQKAMELNDRFQLMRLLVTVPMILNYQENEMPVIDPLKSVFDEYEVLIKRVEAAIPESQ